jgi:hypothetical protein
MKRTTANRSHLLLNGALACAVAALAGANALAADAKPNEITAIDILLVPDSTMIPPSPHHPGAEIRPHRESR